MFKGANMKIAISASSPSLDSEVNPRFGRCDMFIIADPKSIDFEVVDNAGESAGGGAGISTAQMIAQKNVEVVITGNCGPNAHRVLSSAGIEIITGAEGTVRQVIEDYNNGKLSSSSGPNVSDHFGMGGGGGHCRGKGKAN